MTLNPTLSDRLRELGNIGCAHALRALSRMTDTEYIIRVPDIELLAYSDMPGRLGDAQAETIGVMLDVSGELDGVFLLLLRPPVAARILRGMGVCVPERFYPLSPLQRSALLELGNILCNAYMTAVWRMTGLQTRFSVPACACDMLGAILNLPVVRFARGATRVLCVENAFTLPGDDWAGGTLLLPTLESARRLSERLEAWQ